MAPKSPNFIVTHKLDGWSMKVWLPSGVVDRANSHVGEVREPAREAVIAEIREPAKVCDGHRHHRELDFDDLEIKSITIKRRMKNLVKGSAV